MIQGLTDVNEVTKLIRKIKTKRSTGHDPISNKILDTCLPKIEHYLVEAINQAI